MEPHSHSFRCGNKQVVGYVFIRTDIVEKVVDFLSGLRWIVVLDLLEATSIHILMTPVCVQHPRSGEHWLVVIVVVIQREGTRT
jgi:hypothetical protein